MDNILNLSDYIESPDCGPREMAETLYTKVLMHFIDQVDSGEDHDETMKGMITTLCLNAAEEAIGKGDRHTAVLFAGLPLIFNKR